jgi:hypothetical protein
MFAVLERAFGLGRLGEYNGVQAWLQGQLLLTAASPQETIMDNKTKTAIGALFLASSIGVGVGRLTAAPSQPDVKIVGMSIEPNVSNALVVGDKMQRIQCSDVNGPVTKLNGQDFTAGADLCDAANKFATGAKASVGLLANTIAQMSAKK